jgi:hypothetical protein
MSRVDLSLDQEEEKMRVFLKTKKNIKVVTDIILDQDPLIIEEEVEVVMIATQRKVVGDTIDTLDQDHLLIEKEEMVEMINLNKAIETREVVKTGEESHQDHQRREQVVEMIRRKLHGEIQKREGQ